jgi:hypothetical protein
MMKPIILLSILLSVVNSIQAQTVLKFEDPCNYVTTNPSKYNKKLTEYAVYSISSDYDERIHLRYYQSDETFQNTQTVYTGAGGSYRSTSTVRPMIFSLELNFKNLETPVKNYYVEIVFSDGHSIKKKLSYKTFNPTEFTAFKSNRWDETPGCCSVGLKLKKKHLKLFRNSTIKEITFNGDTRVIDPEQARVIQMGAECMSTNNIFAPTKKPKEKKQRN